MKSIFNTLAKGIVLVPMIAIKGIGAIFEIVWVVVLLKQAPVEATSEIVLAWTGFIMISAIGRAGADLELVSHATLLSQPRQNEGPKILKRVLSVHAGLTFKLSLIFAICFWLSGADLIFALWFLITPCAQVITALIADYRRASQRLEYSALISGPALWIPPVLVALGLNSWFEQPLDAVAVLYLFTFTTSALATIGVVTIFLTNGAATTSHQKVRYEYDARPMRVLANPRAKVRIFALMAANLPFWIISITANNLDLASLYESFRIASSMLILIYAIDMPMYPELTLARQANERALTREIAMKYFWLGIMTAPLLASLVYSANEYLSTQHLSYNYADPKLLLAYLGFYCLSVVTAPMSAVLIVMDKAKVVADLYLANTICIGILFFFADELLGGNLSVALVFVFFSSMRLIISSYHCRRLAFAKRLR